MAEVAEAFFFTMKLGAIMGAVMLGFVGGLGICALVFWVAMHITRPLVDRMKTARAVKARAPLTETGEQNG